MAPEPMHLTAPGAVRFCSRCAAPMTTRAVGGRPRRVCGTCGFVHFVDPKVGVGVAVLDADRLLLVRRAMEPERGRWGLPAGYLDAGETPRETAAREALEETGLVVEVGDLVDVYADPGGPGASLFLLYRARRVGGTLAAADDVDDARFFAEADLPAEDRIAFPSTHDALRRWRAGQL